MNNKTVVISGGSRGLGQHMVSAFLKKGCKVACFSRESNSFIKNKLTAESERFYWEKLDINDHVKISEFIFHVKERFGRIDVLINNLAELAEGLFIFSSNEKINSMLNTNIVAPMLLTRECVKDMLKNGEGTILNISSINSVKGHKGVTIYSACKAAIDGMMRSLARELGPSKIRVNSLVPGFFDSEMVSYLSEERRKQILKRTPLGQLSTAESISNVALFLCSDDAVNITGQNIIVDGGLTC